MTGTHGVVIGGGLAGTLAAVALADVLDRVTIVERDRLPRRPAPRRGLPQARHAHLLWSGGARAIESLLPGTTAGWLDAGAHRIGLPDGLVSLSAQGWTRRWPEMQFLVTCSRDLLDWVVRERVLGHPRIDLRDGCDVLGPLGDSARLTGVRVRTRAGADATDLPADLVVDASGRGSAAAGWLTTLGLPAVGEVVVDSGLAYATRIFRAPPVAATGFPVVNVQADPRQPRPGQTATLLPIEQGRWLVTLSGTRGGEPPVEADRFVAFARAVRHPVVTGFIAAAEPLGPVHGTRGGRNRRRFFERLPRWPDGFVVLGDAVASYNPVYGQGMSVAAHHALALRAALDRHGTAPGTARRIQRTVGRTVDSAWSMATGQDILYPGATGPRPGRAAALAQRYLERLTRTANERPAVARALLDTITLSAPATTLFTPAVALATLRGPGHPPLPGPPLTESEAAILGGSPAAPEPPGGPETVA